MYGTQCWYAVKRLCIPRRTLWRYTNVVLLLLLLLLEIHADFDHVLLELVDIMNTEFNDAVDDCLFVAPWTIDASVAIH